MTVRTLVAAIPPVKVISGMVLKLEAIDPTTAAAVSGVTCSRWAIYGEPLEDDTSGSSVPVAGPFMLVPGPDSTGG